MARAVWSGSLTFGLVTVPVQLLPATESHTVRFHQLQRGTSDRVRSRRVNERTGKEVPYDKIVKGYEDADGQYVVIEPEELDDITPGRSKSIEIDGFVKLEAIDPIYFSATYFVQPRREHRKPYRLLRDALADTGRAGVAVMSMRQKEYLVAVHEEGGVMVMHTLHWADEVRDPHETIENLPSRSKAKGKELKTAVQLIEAMAADWDPTEYRDRTQERVRELIEAKQSGKKPSRASKPPKSTNVTDLMAVLEESVENARAGRASKRRKSANRRKKPASQDLAQLNKHELYELATKADITGRSRMSRDELQKALQKGALKAA